LNFLLHRHLAERDLASSAAGLGAMLPDVWRMADRRVRPSLLVEAGEEGLLAEVLQGVRHHLVVDEWFHKHSVFLVGEREAADRLRAAQLVARHAGMFAHVLWELCLDGALVRREGERALQALREGVDRANGVASEAAERAYFSRVERPPGERARFEERVGRILRELARGPWVLGYATGEGIAARIDGVRGRLGLGGMGREDLARLAGVASGLEERAGEAVAEIVATRSFVA
jgi:hypothetical protein